MSTKIDYSRTGDIAVLRIQNPPVNALSQAVREGLVEGIEKSEADEGVQAQRNQCEAGEGEDAEAPHHAIDRRLDQAVQDAQADIGPGKLRIEPAAHAADG